MTRKTDNSYSDKLSADLATLMNYSGEEPTNERDRPEIREDLVRVTASCWIGDDLVDETTVCTPDVPNDVVGEVVGEVIRRLHDTNSDILHHEIRIRFDRATDL